MLADFDIQHVISATRKDILQKFVRVRKNSDQQQTVQKQSRSRNSATRRCNSRGGARQTFTIREPESGDALPILRVGSKTVHPIMVEITIYGKRTLMELDMGATVLIISTTTKDKLFPEEKLTESSLILTIYSGEQLKIAGQMLVNVKYGRQQHQFPVYVVNGNGPSLMGRNWLQKITLNWKSLNLAPVPDSQTTRSPKQKVEAIVDAHKNVFKEGLGQINTFEATLQLKPGQNLSFVKPAQFLLF